MSVFSKCCTRCRVERPGGRMGNCTMSRLLRYLVCECHPSTIPEINSSLWSQNVIILHTACTVAAFPPGPGSCCPCWIPVPPPFSWPWRSLGHWLSHTSPMPLSRSGHKKNRHLLTFPLTIASALGSKAVFQNSRTRKYSLFFSSHHSFYGSPFLKHKEAMRLWKYS